MFELVLMFKKLCCFSTFYRELTDASLKIIGDTCSNLQAIDLTNLRKLTDISIGHLANGCQAIQMLRLSRNAFRY